jgi:hydrogenase maturation protease
MTNEPTILAADASRRNISNEHWATVVAGVGSPFGDDQAGWRIVEMLERRPNVRARFVKVHDVTELLDALDDCRKLVIVDGCRGVCRVGAVTRLTWPDSRICKRHSHSTHGIGVCDALRLAEQLGRLPPEVVIYGIEVGDCEPGREICLEVLQSVAELEAVIGGELYEAAHA